MLVGQVYLWFVGSLEVNIEEGKCNNQILHILHVYTFCKIFNH